MPDTGPLRLAASRLDTSPASGGGKEPQPFLPREAGEVATPALRRGSRRGLLSLRKQALWLAAFLGAVLAADMALPPPLIKAAGVSPLVLDREGRWIHAFPANDGRWRFQADLDAIDPSFVERLIAVEDKRFLRHPGVDPAAVLRAAASSARAGAVVSGASTITMQTARLLEPRPRTILSKIAEMLRALQIESRLSKREILELYLTLAPYGGNLEGVRAASLSYFGHEPRHLSDAEQALLIALPQAPETRRPDRHPGAAAAARAAVLARFEAIGAIARERAAEAREAPAPTVRTPFSRNAYHAARTLAHAANIPRDGIIRSSLDLRVQREAEALVAKAAAPLKDGATIALMVVDHRARAVRAAVGSASLKDAGGWIDLTSAVRSPGSTLKPFIYALAFDDGIAGPKTVIEDMPQSFDGYAPENFDRTFRGEVRLNDALQHSLNVPAVSLLNRLSSARLAAMLGAAGVDLKAPKRADRRFGLTLALGGAGVAMSDLATLYAGLANGGSVAPLLWSDDPLTPDHGFQMFSPTSAHRVSEILRESPALEGRVPSQLSKSAPKVAFKTGTSYGYRDAWAAGHAGRYTVVVWVGRADGASRPGETGRKAAAPILIDIFDLLARLDPDGAKEGVDHDAEQPIAIARIAAPRRLAPPEIVFPRHGVELFADGEGRGVALAARGGSGGYRWYVDGDVVDVEESGRSLWVPKGPGFYDIVVVDSAGGAARSKVRIAVPG